MKIYVGRQPIFNRNEDCIAYELLYRNSEGNFFPNVTGEEATTDVLLNSFLNIGIEELTEGKLCFINFTEQLLKEKIPTMFPFKTFVIEILEDIPITEELIRICQEYKKQGYILALDDFRLRESDSQLIHKLMDTIHILKVDYLNCTRAKREAIVKKYRDSNVKFLAEKVETREDFKEALLFGYDLFQGYFFSKPTIISRYDLPTHFHTSHQILMELNESEPDIDKITGLIEQDLSLSYKLLKLINSPVYRPKNKIHSIKQAIVLLSLNEIRKWVYILAIKVLKVKDSREQEVMKLSLFRGKLCELIAGKKGYEKPSSYMLTGMFSLIDTLLNRKLEDILQELPLADEIQQAITGEKNQLNQVLNWAIKIEQLDFDNPNIPLDKSKTYECYREAIIWSSRLLSTDLK